MRGKFLAILCGGLFLLLVLGKPWHPPGAISWDEALFLGSCVALLAVRELDERTPSGKEATLFLLCVVVLSTLGALLRECGTIDSIVLEQIRLRALGSLPLDQSEIFNVPWVALTWLEGLLILSITRRTAFRKYIPLLLVSVGVILAFTGLLQRLEPDALPQHWLKIEPSLRRVGSIFDDPNILGSVLCLIAPLLAEGRRASTGRPRWLWSLALGLVALCTILTWSRAAIGALALWGALDHLGQAHRAPRNWSARWLVLAAFGLGLFLWLEKGATLDWIHKTLGQESLETALGGRASIWRHGCSMVHDFPALGSGPGSVYQRYALYCEDCTQKGEGVLPGSQLEGRNLHNLFLQVAAELGVLGLTSFLWLLGSILSPSGADERSSWERAARAGVFLFLLTGLTGHPLVDRAASNLFWLACGLAMPPIQSKAGAPRWWRRGLWFALLAGGGRQTLEAWTESREAVFEVGIYGAPTAGRSWDKLVLSGSRSDPKLWWWMGSKSRITLIPRGTHMKIPVLLRTPDLQRNPLVGSVRVEGQLRTRRVWTAPGGSDLELDFHRSELGRVVELRIEANRVFWKDGRPLGLALRAFEFTQAESDGFWPVESDGAWSRLSLEGVFRNTGNTTLSFSVSHPDLEREALSLRVYGSGQEVRNLLIRRPGLVQVSVPGIVGQRVRLELSRTWSPLRYGISSDSRELGLYFSILELKHGPVEWGHRGGEAN